MRTFATRFLWRITLVLVAFCCAAASRLHAASASFTWDPSPDAATGKVAGYKFYYSTLNFISLPLDVILNPAFTVINVTSGTSVTLPGLVDGLTYHMTVTAFDASGHESVPSNILSYTAGQPVIPLSVAITDPVSPLTISSTTSVTITAIASGSAAITKVEFFDGTSLLATKTSAPYTFNQTFATGVHVVIAKATDANNATSTSAPVTITSSASPVNVPPTVSIVGLTSGAMISPPVTLIASASDPDGSIVSVEFFANSTSLRTLTTPPYTIVPNFISGTYTFKVKATDNSGAVTFSAPITATVKPPPPLDLTIK